MKAKNTARTPTNARVKKIRNHNQKIQNTLEKTVVEDQVKEIRSHSPVDQPFLPAR